MTEKRRAPDDAGNLYARLPESARTLIEKHLRNYLLRTLSPSEVERTMTLYLARNEERLAREWHRQFGEEMLTAAELTSLHGEDPHTT